MPDDLAATLAEIQEREQAATPGPWIAYGIGDDEVWSETPWDHVAETMGNVADARFIAAARTDVPSLLAAVEAVLKLADDAVLESIDASGAACAWDLDPAKVRETIRAALGEEAGDE